MGSIKILYGVESNYTDVTDTALFLCCDEKKQLTIPKGDHERGALFGDTVPGVLKHIRIITEEVYPASCATNLDLSRLNINDKLKGEGLAKPKEYYLTQRKLWRIHEKLKFEGGKLTDEYPEQILTVMFLDPSDVVLELGSNIGRNTLIIASILNNQTNLVTLECDPKSCAMLEKNKTINNYQFHIENSALSYKPLIQKGWATMQSDVVLPGYTAVSCITFEQLQSKYKLNFNTLVADCEGALFHILKSNPSIMTNINKVIVENDYSVLEHKLYVDQLFQSAGLKRVYHQSGGWGPCKDFFYEVWIRS